MGRDLYDVDAARAIFDLADEALGFPISRLCFDGPEEELRQTINAQPALVTVSLACLAAARELSDLPSPDFLAGHSLGEYTALAVAGVVSSPTAIQLARERGRLMFEAGLVRPGTMAAILGLEEAQLAGICRETDTRIANANCPGQMVISGDRDRVAQAVELAKAQGAQRAIPLQVSGAFHSHLMQPAVESLTRIVDRTTFHDPAIAIIGNTTARPMITGEEVRTELVQQMCNCVQWQRSVEYMVAQGVSTFYEIGPGKVLSGLIKRINKEARTVSISDLASIKALAGISS
ncbi:MAG: ACP S-malonyltransferase [Chloroflexi bacterium]|nr:ACP S-malonyltransferase [Chloroflexota bacterium]